MHNLFFQLYLSSLGRSESIIEKHRTKANILKLNVRGRAFEKVYKLLKEKRLAYITGKIGSGKTHTALDVITTFIEEFENFKPLVVSSPLDLDVLENTASYIIVLADDLVRHEDSHKWVLNGWRHVMKYIIPLIERKRLCFIFTSEATNIESLAEQTDSMHGLLGNQNLVNLDDEDICFSMTEQNKMLTLYSKHFCKLLYTRPTEIEEHVLAHNGSLGFPLMCNLVGIEGKAKLFSDPYGALSAFVSEQYEYHFPNFFLFLLVLITEKDCSVLNFQHENQSVFEKLSDITCSHKCTHSEVSIGLTQLKRQNILVEEESGNLSFAHELIAAEVFARVLTTFGMEDFIPLLPVEVLNALVTKPDTYFQNLDQKFHSITNLIESSTEALRAIASKFSSVLDSKQPEDFMNVASSHMWSIDLFVHTVLSLLGCQFFFIEDIHKTPLSAYLVRTGHLSVISKTIDCVRSMPRQIVLMTKGSIEKTKLEACRFNETETLNQLLGLSNEKDFSHAAIEGGNVDILKLTMHQNTNDSRTVSREMLQLACKCGHFDIIKYLFSKLYIKLDSGTSKLIEMRKQNNEGETLLHYAALGGNVMIFEFLLEQKCDPTSRTYEGNSVLHFAAMFGHFQMVRYICARFPALLREKNKYDFTAVHFAAREGHDDVLQVLVARESNIIDMVKGGNTILHLAAANGHLAIIRFIQLVNPMQQDTANSSSLLPVHLAVQNGSVDTLILFLKNGTDIMTKTVDKRSLLHFAAFYGQLDMVRYLCTCKPKLIHKLDIEGNTVGHEAAASGNVEVLKYLIEKGVDPLSPNKYKTTLLHEACFNGHLGMVKFLCASYPALMNIISENEFTICFGAAICGSVEIFKFLVENGADAKATSREGSTVLHEAAYSGKLDIVCYLCTNFPDMIEARNKETYMPCHFAAQEGHLEVLNVLLSGKSIPLPTTRENQSLLHIASYNGRMMVVKHLCKKYPTIISDLDKEKSSALHYAARGGNKEILQYLVDHGLDPESCTQSGSTILHLAAYDGNTDIVLYICSQYPQLINILDSTGHTAAHYAAGSGEVPVLLNILKYGTDPLLRSSNGSTLLLKAAYSGKFEMVQYLCEEYPELTSMSDAFGCNALHYAACAGNTDIVKYVISLGIDPRSRTNDGHTILHVAAFHGQVNLAKHICQLYPDLLDVNDNSGKTAEQTAKDHNRNDVVHFFGSLRERNLGDTLSSTGVFSDICCCEGTNVFELIWRGLENVLCCCRR